MTLSPSFHRSTEIKIGKYARINSPIRSMATHLLSQPLSLAFNLSGVHDWLPCIFPAAIPPKEPGGYAKHAVSNHELVLKCIQCDVQHMRLISLENTTQRYKMAVSFQNTFSAAAAPPNEISSSSGFDSTTTRTRTARARRGYQIEGVWLQCSLVWPPRYKVSLSSKSNSRRKQSQKFQFNLFR